MKRGSHVCRRTGGCGLEKSHHRHRRLLPARRERPRDRRAAEQRDELASFQVIEFHSVPCAARAGLQDIELARISQEVSGRLPLRKSTARQRICSKSAGSPHLARRFSGPAPEGMRECAHLMKAEQPRNFRYMQLAIIEVPNHQIAPQLLKYFSELQPFVRKFSCSVLSLIPRLRATSPRITLP